MASYKKTTIANQYREELRRQVEKYLVNRNDIEPNSGQLKFLKGLMIRSLAISTRIRINQPKKQLLDFLNKNILKSNDEVICFFDNDKNAAAFLRSPYCKPLEWPQIFNMHFQTFLKERFVSPPFLLLQKTQDVMEHALLNYMKEPFDDEDDAEMLKKKMKSFINLLYSITLYEIFLREFCEKMNHSYLKNMETLIDDTDDRIQELCLKLDNLLICKNEKKQKELNDYIETQALETSDYITAASLTVFYTHYFYQHLTNFFAILRIIFLIEFVNINEANNPISPSKERQLNLKEAIVWRGYIEKWMENGELFIVQAQNRNMGILYNEWNRLYHKYISSDSDISKCQANNIREYLQAIQTHTVSERMENEAEERSLWRIADNLALPIFKAASDICNLPKTILEKKGNSKNG